MQLFLDTTDIGLLKEFTATGLVDGVTTNPSLIAKSGRPMLEVIAEICELVEGPVSAEVAATDVEGMLAEGEKLAKVAANVVVKLPLTRNGLIATAEFAVQGIETNVTLCFSAAQALLVFADPVPARSWSFAGLALASFALVVAAITVIAAAGAGRVRPALPVWVAGLGLVIGAAAVLSRNATSSPANMRRNSAISTRSLRR